MMARAGDWLSAFLLVFIAVFSAFHLLAGKGRFHPSDRTRRIVRDLGFFVLIVVAIYGLLSFHRG